MTDHTQSTLRAGQGAVAKGIRRVICLTGAAAFKAASTSEALRAELEAASALDGKPLQAAQKKLLAALAEATISVSDKHELNLGADRLTKKLMALQKEEYATAMAGAAAAAKAALDAGKSFAVYAVPQPGAIAPKLGADLTKKLKKTPVALLLTQAEDDSVAFFASVPKASQGALNAKEWVEHAGAACAVKGGGSAGMFNGRGSGAGEAAACLAKAEAFAAEKLAK
jgi:alanyl-tRNA synthetase